MNSVDDRQLRITCYQMATPVMAHAMDPSATMARAKEIYAWVTADEPKGEGAKLKAA